MSAWVGKGHRVVSLARAQVRMAPEEKTVTLTKIEAPMKSSSEPWKAAISVFFWREMWPWP